MRISTTWQYQLGFTQMQKQQSKLTDTQLKMASGQKYLKPSENPQATASLIDFNQRIKVYEQYQDNIVIVRQRLEQENSGVGTGVEVVQRIRELAVQALNDTNQAVNRQQLAKEIDQLNGKLLDISNTQTPSGEYLFSGYASNKRTYDDTTSPYTYQGDAQRSQAIGPARTVTDSDTGEQTFGQIQATPTVGSIENVFQAVEMLSANLKTNTPNANSLTDLDRALERFTTVQVSIGARLKALDVQEGLNSNYILDHKTMVSEIGDLDYAEAVSNFNLQQVALQAAQQSFAKVQDLSLFKYI